MGRGGQENPKRAPIQSSKIGGFGTEQILRVKLRSLPPDYLPVLMEDKPFCWIVPNPSIKLSALAP